MLTAICYLSSLLFFGMGYSKMLVLNSGNVNTYDFTTYVSLATGYFVLAIFFVVIGSLFFFVKNNREQGIIDIQFSEEAGRELVVRRRASILEVKAQLTQSRYGLDLDKRVSS
jgi:amino acid transporter